MGATQLQSFNTRPAVLMIRERQRISSPLEQEHMEASPTLRPEIQRRPRERSAVQFDRRNAETRETCMAWTSMEKEVISSSSQWLRLLNFVKGNGETKQRGLKIMHKTSARRQKGDRIFPSLCPITAACTRPAFSWCGAGKRPRPTRWSSRCYHGPSSRTLRLCSQV